MPAFLVASDSMKHSCLTVDRAQHPVLPATGIIAVKNLTMSYKCPSDLCLEKKQHKPRVLLAVPVWMN